MACPDEASSQPSSGQACPDPAALRSAGGESQSSNARLQPAPGSETHSQAGPGTGLLHSDRCLVSGLHLILPTPCSTGNPSTPLPRFLNALHPCWPTRLGVWATPSLLPGTAARQPGSRTVHTLPVGSCVLPFLKPQGGHRPHFKHDPSLSQDGTNGNLEDGNISNRGEGRKAARGGIPIGLGRMGIPF